MKLTKKGAALLATGLVLVTTAVVGVVFGRKKRAAKRLAEQTTNPKLQSKD